MHRGINHGAHLPEILKKAREEFYLAVLIKRNDIHPYALKLVDHLIVVLMSEFRVKLEHFFLCLSHASFFLVSRSISSIRLLSFLFLTFALILAQAFLYG